MSTRPFQPPPPPLESSAPPEVSSALRKGSGSQTVGNRTRFVAAFAFCFLAAWAVPWVAWQLLAYGDDWAPILWWAMGIEAVFVIGAVWFGLTFLQDVSQLGAMWWLWRQQIAAWAAHWAVLRQSQAHYARRWYQPPPAPAPPRIVKGDQNTVDIAARAAVERLQRDIEASLARLAPATAPAPSPCPTEADTVHLPESGPVAAVYYGGCAHRLVASALCGEAITSRALTPAYMSRPQYDAARAQLLGAGVLVPGERGGVRLAPGLRALSEDAAHAAVVRMLTQKGGR